MGRRALRFLKLGVLFLFIDITIGSRDILPDFVGLLLLAISLQNQDVPTEAERRIRPLFYMLAADSFLHWLSEWENGLETLLVTVISCYALFVLFGEVAERIRPGQPDRAMVLKGARIGMVFMSTVNFVTSAYENGIWEVIHALVMAAAVMILAVTLAAIWKIRPEEGQVAGNSTFV